MTTLRKHLGVVASGTGPKLRTLVNLVNNPRALGPKGISGSITSGGGVTARSTVQTGGPTPACPSFSRVTLVDAQTAGTVTQYNGAAGYNLVTPGKNYIAKGWMRMSISGNGQMKIGSYLDTKFVKSLNGPVVNLTANAWTPFELEFAVADGTDRIQINLDQASGGPFIPVSGTVDATGWMLFEKPEGVTTLDSIKYADGDTPGWSWDGVAHQSVSRGFGGIG